MSTLSEMPVVTVEQVVKFREAALLLGRQVLQLEAQVSQNNVDLLELESERKELRAALQIVVDRPKSHEAFRVAVQTLAGG